MNYPCCMYYFFTRDSITFIIILSFSSSLFLPFIISSYIKKKAPEAGGHSPWALWPNTVTQTVSPRSLSRAPWRQFWFCFFFFYYFSHLWNTFEKKKLQMKKCQTWWHALLLEITSFEAALSWRQRKNSLWYWSKFSHTDDNSFEMSSKSLRTISGDGRGEVLLWGWADSYRVAVKCMTTEWELLLNPSYSGSHLHSQAQAGVL